MFYSMSEDEHSDSEFYYPREPESHEENSEATALSGYEQEETAKKEIRASYFSKRSLASV